MPEFSHFNDQGRARMVDVTEKAPTFRRAAAAGEVHVSKETLDAIREGKLKKGDDPLKTAQTFVGKYASFRAL